MCTCSVNLCLALVLLCCVIFGQLTVFKNNFIWFWFHWIFVAVQGLSLIAESEGYSVVAVCGLLTAMTSLVSEHGHWDTQPSVVAARGSSSCGAQALKHRFGSYGTQA